MKRHPLQIDQPRPLHRSDAFVTWSGERNARGAARIDCVEREIHFSEKQVKEVLDGQSYLALQQSPGHTSCFPVLPTCATDESSFERRAWLLSSGAPNLLTRITPFHSSFLDTSCEEPRMTVFNALANVGHA